MTTATITPSEVSYRPQPTAENQTCFAHRHLTMEEYGLWTHARQLAHESGIFYFDGRNIAKRFGETGKNAVYRVGKNLIRKGWLIVIREPKRLKNGMFSPGQYRPLSHDEWGTEHPGTCPGIGTGKDSTSPGIEIDLSRNRERPVLESGHNMKGLSIKGECKGEEPEPSSSRVQDFDLDTSSNSRSHRMDDDDEIKTDQSLIPNHQDPNQAIPLSSSSPRVDSNKEVAVPPNEDAILARVWSHYLAATGKDPVTNTLTPVRRKLGKARLRECLTRTKGNHEKAALLMECAIDGITKSDWAMGRNSKTKGQSYCDWERHIFASEEMMERLWNS